MKRLKLIGVELVKERRKYDNAVEMPDSDATRGKSVWLDYAVVYIELEGGIRLKLIEELAESMYDHHVTDSGIRSRYMQTEGVEVEVEES